MLNKNDQKIQWLPTENISVVWANAQRPFDDRRKRAAERIAEHFDPDEFGTVTVTLPNGQGVYHCIDGQTRIAAVRSLWGDGQKVPCVVVNAADPARAAEIFLNINTGRTPPTAIENFHVAVTAGRRAEVEINKLVESLGYVVGNTRADGHISAVQALLQVYKRDGSIVLRDTLVAIKGVWGMAREATEASVIRGFAHLLAENPEADRGRLIDKVQEDKEIISPDRLVALGRLRAEALKMSVAVGVASILADVYNKKMTGKRRLHVT